MKSKFSFMPPSVKGLSYNFMLIVSEEQKKIVFRDLFKNIIIKESAYTILSTKMQISIHTLQK